MNSDTFKEESLSVLEYRPAFLKGILYGALSFLSIYLFYILGSAGGSIFTDPKLASMTYQPFLAVLFILIIIFSLNRKRPVITAYLTGAVLVGYMGMAILEIPDTSLLIFPAISAALLLLMYRSFNGTYRGGMTRVGVFFAAVFIMLIIGGAIRFVQNPGEYSLLVGSIYDDENPAGVPFLYYDAIVFYGRYMVVTISLPIMFLFSALSSVLVENYLGIFRLSSSSKYGAIGKIGKSANVALTALSCQCEGITAVFPSIVATLLFAAIIPLISFSIALVALTNFLLFNYFLKGRKSLLLERIWNIPSSRKFLYLASVIFILVPLITILILYYGFERNLLAISFINISMFLYGILLVYGLREIFTFKWNLKRYSQYFLGICSSVLMFSWYVPSLTHYAAFTISGFLLMAVAGIASGLISGGLFMSLQDRVRRLYLQYLTMMFSTLAIIIFYLTSISLLDIWPYFGVTEQLAFSLILWGVSLPFVWLSTNIALNSENLNAVQGKTMSDETASVQI